MTQSNFARWGRIGALRLHATHDSRVVTAPARAAFLGKFRTKVIAEAAARGQGALDEPEIERRAALLRRAHMSRLSLIANPSTH